MVLHGCGLLLQWNSMIFLLVCLSVTLVSCAETAELKERLFGIWTRVGPTNRVLDVGPAHPCKGAILRGEKGGPL